MNKEEKRYNHMHSKFALSQTENGRLQNAEYGITEQRNN